MSIIQTYTGNYVDLVNPSRDSICIDDIAHALSNVNRFTGHTAQAYSVAQHSFHVSHLVPAEHALEALLHDAAEAYLGDVATPLKNLLPGYRELEKRMDAVIRDVFDLPESQHPSVKIADLQMLARERLDLLGHDGSRWLILDGIEVPERRITPWTNTYSEGMFMWRYQYLTKYKKG